MTMSTLSRACALCVVVLVAAFAPRPAAAEPPAPPTTAPDALAALQRRIDEQDRLIARMLADNLQLRERVERMEQSRPAPATSAPPVPTVPPLAPGEPEIPRIALPGETGSASDAVQPAVPAPSGARASLAPDLSVIGNNVGRFFSVRGDADRNRMALGEVEIALEQPVYPGVRFNAMLAAGADSGFAVSAEEANISFSRVAGLPVGGVLGRKRVAFGKANAVHPHALPYADTPAALAALLGPDGLIGNGISFNYLLPVKSLFANLQLGYVSPEVSDVTGSGAGTSAPTPLGVGVGSNLRTARLWMAPDVGRAASLEAGVSHVWGADVAGSAVAVSGLDLTWRAPLAGGRKLTAQAEAIWHRRRDDLGLTGWHTRSGYYGLLDLALGQYRGVGLRYDNTRNPWPIAGADQSLSLIWTNRLAEATLLRFQLKRGNRSSDLLLPARAGYTELYLQFIWGAGSHTHPLN